MIGCRAVLPVRIIALLALTCQHVVRIMFDIRRRRMKYRRTMTDLKTRFAQSGKTIPDVARAMGIHVETVRRYVNGTIKVPSHRAREFALLTEIDLEIIRPDIWPPPDAAGAA